MKYLLLLMLGSCTSLAEPDASIDAAAVTPLWSKVLDRHDAYVTGDEVPQAQKDMWLLDSTLLRKILEEASGNTDQRP